MPVTDNNPTIAIIAIIIVYIIVMTGLFILGLILSIKKGIIASSIIPIINTILVIPSLISLFNNTFGIIDIFPVFFAIINILSFAIIRLVKRNKIKS